MPMLNVTDPALQIDPLVCGGFFGGGPATWGRRSRSPSDPPGPGDDPSILALFPNNAPSRTPTIVGTQT